MHQLLSVVICTLILLKSAEGVTVPITYVQSAVAKGAGKELLLLCLIMENITLCVLHIISIDVYTFCAVCLDGSPPAYHFDKGFEGGIDNWIVHFEVCQFMQTGIIYEY
jgi:hypothetical protein